MVNLTEIRTQYSSVCILCVCLTRSYVESGYTPAQETHHCLVCQHGSLCVCVMQ